MRATHGKPALRLVHAAPEVGAEWDWFCGRCAARPAATGAPAPSARVCSSCGLGVLLETPRDAAPQPGDAFLIVDATLSVQAMSQTAERLLGIEEDLALHRPVTQLLVQADSEAGGARSFADALTGALVGDGPTSSFVRPWNTFGIHLRARIARCGPPPAALLVLEA